MEFIYNINLSSLHATEVWRGMSVLSLVVVTELSTFHYYFSRNFPPVLCCIIDKYKCNQC